MRKEFKITDSNGNFMGSLYVEGGDADHAHLNDKGISCVALVNVKRLHLVFREEKGRVQ